MIKLTKLNKYFNKNRNNEIHVINDISLELPNTGLVVLLGPSGSGKTTLLNVLGGLDKVQEGSIQFDDEVIGKYKANKWDDIRNENIGYIFQNYNLLTEMTVKDNISITLNMVGIYDEEEIDKRVDYILEKMHMQNYKRRRASQLSGGQQQRVAIARALAKNPKVIIADEPTGNLDSKNTYDIMNIIKSISREKLVVLVTHERHLATQYGDRIIELKDGQIVEDIVHTSTGTKDVMLETDIYLKDLNKVTELKGPSTNYKIYSDEEINNDINIRLIVRNKTLFVEVDTEKYQRVNLLNKNSEITIFDEDVAHEEIVMEETPFELDDIVDDSLKTHRFNVISVKDAIKIGFKRFRDPRRGVKFINVMFMVISGFIALAVAMIFNVFNLEINDYFYEPVETVVAEVDRELTYEEMLIFESQSHIAYVNLVPNVSFEIELPLIYQSDPYGSGEYKPGLSNEFIDESKIVYGTTITGHNQIVLNKDVLNNMVATRTTYGRLGITEAKDFLHLNITYTVRGLENKYHQISAEIVGIIDEENTVFYATEETLFSMGSQYLIYEMYEDELNLDTADFEFGQFIYNESFSSQDQVLNVKGIDFFKVDTINSQDINSSVLIMKEHVRQIQFSGNYTELHIISKDKEETIEYFNSLEISAVDFFANQTQRARSFSIQEAIGTLTFAAVFLGASALATFFILRSSLMSRIYEVSVYRALGAKKRDLRKMFLVEIMMLTTLTSFVGYFLVSFVILRIQIATAGFFTLVQISPQSFIAGAALIFGVNIISGLLPIMTLLRQTPSQIMSRYDF